MLNRNQIVEVVSATRLSEIDFRQKSPLALSLQRLSWDTRLRGTVHCNNGVGLPLVFNPRIESDSIADILVFIHDDVWLEDYFFVDRLIEATAVFDVIGVAGCRKRDAGQLAWAFKADSFAWHGRENLSGAVAHGEQPFFSLVSKYGELPAECDLLDGVMLAARKSKLVESNIRFDPKFDFHFYDVDFCRQCCTAGLKLGTWPISLTHVSRGNFGSPSWQLNRERFVSKWLD